MFRANPSWNLSSDVSSCGILQQGVAALLSLGAPCPSLPLVRPTLVCILQSHGEQRPRVAGHLWVPSTSTGLHIQHKPINICWTKGVSLLSSQPRCSTFRRHHQAFAWPSRWTPMCYSDAGASATWLSSALASWLCVFSGVPCYLKADLH